MLTNVILHSSLQNHNNTLERARVDIRQRFRWNDWWLQKYSQVYRALKIISFYR